MINKQELFFGLVIMVSVIGAYWIGVNQDIIHARFFAPENITQAILILDEELSQTQKNYAMSIYDSLNPVYTERLKKVTFTNNITKHIGKHGVGCSKLYGGPNSCGGLSNPNTQEIIVKFGGQHHTYVKEILCHEILHQWIPIKSNNMTLDASHRVIRELAQDGVCYE